MYSANDRAYSRANATASASANADTGGSGGAASASTSRILLRRAGCCLLAVLLAFALIPLSPFAERAYAASSWLDVGAEVPYGGYTTNEFWVDGVIAYCGEPSMATPGSGSYYKAPVYVQQNDYNPTANPYELVRTLYYGYGGPGFDPSMWPKYDHEGNPMSRDIYIAVTHIMVAECFSYDTWTAIAGTTQQFRDWCYNEIFEWKPEGYAQVWHGLECNIIDRDAADPLPASFANECFCMTTSGGCQVICGHNPGGIINLSKVSSSPDITNSNPAYTLRGARYDVFSDAACTNRLLAAYTDARGHAKYYVRPGTYYIKEVASPTGYAKDETVHTIYVPNGGTAKLDAEDVPQSCAPDALLEKYDSEIGYSEEGNLPQGSASIEGAEFNVAYYYGYKNSVEEATSGSPVRSWTVRTDENGKAKLDDAHKVSGDDFYRNSAGEPALPLGTYVISETEPPKGYLNDSANVFLRHVRANGSVEQALYDAPHVGNQVIRGNITMEKRDAESGLFTPLGAAELDGATFEVVNDSAQAVIVEGESREPGEVCATLSIKNNRAQLPDRALPYGHYLIREVAAGIGYRLTDGLPRYFDITSDGETVDFVDDTAFYNYVNRGDLHFEKVHDVDMQRLVGIPFRITSETTFESHVIATDENGELNTSAARVPHTQNTNANDMPEGGYDNCDSHAGIWFGLTQEGTYVTPDDALGALPYDTYTIEELRCSANAGYTLLKLEHIKVSQNDVTLDLGTMQDTLPSINTFALDAADGDKLVMAEPGAKVIDRVEYANLFPGKAYTLRASVVDSANGQPVTDGSGCAISASKDFVPEDVNGVVDVTLIADLTGAGERQLVVFEELLSDGEVVAEHKDANSGAQTFWVKAPKIVTSAADAADGDKRVTASGKCAITDAVSYFNLIPGTEYTLEGKLMVRDAGELQCADGRGVQQTVTFVPDAPSGSVQVTFAFDGIDLPESFDIVVFETLLKGGTTIASHEDMNDSAQTLEFCHPAIETEATDMLDGDKDVAADVISSVLDNVRLTNLVPNRDYTVYGVLVDAEAAVDIDWDAIMKAADAEAAGAGAGAATAEAEAGAGAAGAGEAGAEAGASEAGAEAGVTEAEVAGATSAENEGKLPWIAVAKAQVTSSSEIATTSMEYPLNQQGMGHGALFSGRACVLNILLEEGRIVARHINADNDDQTVSITAPTVVTEAVDFTDGDHNVMPSIDMVVLDTVHYTGLVSGQEYEIRGTLMDKAARTKLTIDDKTIEESLTFTPNNSEGHITVALPVDTSKLPIGTDIVVFEEVFKNGEPIANDKNFNNTNETVRVNRNLKSTAYAKTGVPYQLIPIAMALLIAGGAPLAYMASRRMRKHREFTISRGAKDTASTAGSRTINS